MSYNKTNKTEIEAVKALPNNLRDLAEAIEYEASNDGSFHDSAIDMMEQGEFKSITQGELTRILEAMGSYWDFHSNCSNSFKTE